MNVPIESSNPATTRAVEKITAAVRQLLSKHTPRLLIALDGPSGSGKSTLAEMAAQALNATVVASDDFFAGEITDDEWGKRRPSERAASALDWRRLRIEALEPLLAGKSAQWHAFDFEAGTRDDGTYGLRADLTKRYPATVIILDGAYSTRPELADLIDLTVLVDAPAEIRRHRLAIREAPAFLEAWHKCWDAAEIHYFTQVRPPSSFDLVVATA